MGGETYFNRSTGFYSRNKGNISCNIFILYLGAIISIFIDYENPKIERPIPFGPFIILGFLMVVFWEKLD